jgi:hypothetical protein
MSPPSPPPPSRKRSRFCSLRRRSGIVARTTRKKTTPKKKEKREKTEEGEPRQRCAPNRQFLCTARKEEDASRTKRQAREGHQQRNRTPALPPLLRDVEQRIGESEKDETNEKAKSCVHVAVIIEPSSP